MIEYVRKRKYIHIIEKKENRRNLMGWIDMHCDTLSGIMMGNAAVTGMQSICH